METPTYCETCGGAVRVEATTAEAPCPNCGSLIDVPATCDVFISYATPDLAWAEQISERLAQSGITHWLAPHQIRIGEDFLSKIVAAVEAAKVFVLVLSSASVHRPWVRREISAAVSHDRAVLPLKVEAFDVPADFRFMLTFNQWDELEADAGSSQTIDGLLARVKEELLKCAAAESAKDTAPIKADAPPMELRGVEPTASPYPGPRPFPSTMVDQFFGRFHETKALLRCLGESRVVLVYAPSGAGKSSVLNTVIAQHLRRRGMEVILGGRVAGALPKNVSAASIRNVFTYSLIYSYESNAAPHPEVRLSHFLSARRRDADAVGRVLVLDQFEEIFTHHPERFEDRADFFADVVAALNADPSLKIVFAVRQEFLADVEPHLDALPEALHPQRFALRRMDARGALEALVQPAAPYATFAPGVAEEIIEQLNTIHRPGFDGVLVKKRGEFVEMVHLQIVCTRLWSSLPRGCKHIEREHVRLADEGKDFDEFVVNALNSFYDETVSAVANSDLTRQHGGFSADLIRLGCMKFVTNSATRTMVAQSHGRTGRLPEWIVEQLEGSHLLRAEQRGGERWYELSHDQLAEPISRQMDRKVSTLLYASDLLGKVLARALDDHGQNLSGYFHDHSDVLRECKCFSEQPGLFADEAEFILRASLFEAQDMELWSDRVRRDYPDVWRTVLSDAVRPDRPEEVRRNGATLLATPGSGLEHELVRLVLEESNHNVQRAAAASLATLDSPCLFDTIVAYLRDPQTVRRGRQALSAIRVVADRSGHRPAFDACRYRLSFADAAVIRLKAWHTRLREGLPAVPYMVVPAMFLAATTAAIYKMLPATFGWSIAQKSPGAAVGLFGGATAGVIWGGGIALGLTLYRIVFDYPWKRQSLLRPFGGIVAGGLSGLVTGSLTTLMCATVFERESLRDMGWIQSSQKNTLAFWRELMVQTRYGWGYIIIGTGLGLGMALVINGFRASGEWKRLLLNPHRLTSIREVFHVLREIIRMALRYAWPLPVVLLLTGALAAFLIRPGHGPMPLTDGDAARHLVSPWLGILGDISSQAVGGFFSVCGMLFGVVVMRLGLQVRARKDEL